MKQWEYKIEPDLAAGFQSELLDRLNRLGRDGWELAAIDRGRGVMILKRPTPARRDTDVADAAAGQGG